MFFHTLRIYKNAINEYHDKLVQLWHEYRVHEVHKVCWCICQPKWHNEILIETISRSEGCLGYILSMNLDLVIAGSENTWTLSSELHTVQQSKLGLRHVEPVVCLQGVHRLGKDWRVSHQEIWVWRIPLLMSRLLTVYPMTCLVLHEKPHEIILRGQ
jgi:hypothetical protein